MTRNTTNDELELITVTLTEDEYNRIEAVRQQIVEYLVDDGKGSQPCKDILAEVSCILIAFSPNSPPTAADLMRKNIDLETLVQAGNSNGVPQHIITSINELRSVLSAAVENATSQTETTNMNHLMKDTSTTGSTKGTLFNQIGGGAAHHKKVESAEPDTDTNRLEDESMKKP